MSTSKYIEELRDKVGHKMLLLPAVVAVVTNDKGDILYQRRSDDGTWSLPGGAIDPDETPAQAVVREVKEECGLTVKVERLLGVFGGKDYTCTYPNGDLMQYTNLVFHCTIVSGVLHSTDGESSSIRFFPVAERPSAPVQFPEEIYSRELDGTLFN